jgi:hypothetical protein
MNKTSRHPPKRLPGASAGAAGANAPDGVCLCTQPFQELPTRVAVVFSTGLQGGRSNGVVVDPAATDLQPMVGA